MEGAVLRLKLQVQSVKKVADVDGNISQEEVVLNAVYGPNGSANAQWCKWTPCGNFSFTVSNPQAFDKLRTGQFVFADLTLTDKDAIGYHEPDPQTV
jgi:hypothetical protein